MTSNFFRIRTYGALPAALTALALALAAPLAWAQGAAKNVVESVSFSSVQGGKILVKVGMKEPLAALPQSFAVTNPARIAIDLPDTTGAYAPAYERMMQFYAAGRVHATDAIEVAKVVQHAIETDDPTLRYPVSWGSKELIDGRERISDSDWLALGRTETLDDYMAAFNDAFEVDIST